MAKDTILRSNETTNLNEVPNPAAYDEELAEARLVEQGLGSDVPSTDLDEVTEMGETVLAKTTGNAVPDPTGGTGDLQAAMGGTVTGDPDNPDAVDDSQVPDGYERGGGGGGDLADAAAGMEEALDDTPVERSTAVQGADEEE